MNSHLLVLIAPVELGLHQLLVIALWISPVLLDGINPLPLLRIVGVLVVFPLLLQEVIILYDGLLSLLLALVGRVPLLALVADGHGVL